MSRPDDEVASPVDRRAGARAEKRAAVAERVLDGASRRRGALGPFLLLLAVGLGLLGAGWAANLGRLRSFVLFAGAATTVGVLAVLGNRLHAGRRAKTGPPR